MMMYMILSLTLTTKHQIRLLVAGYVHPTVLLILRGFCGTICPLRFLRILFCLRSAGFD